MLEGKELILATKKYASEERSKSWYYLLSTLLLLATAYGLALFSPFLILQTIASIMAGLIAVRMFIIYHDFLHKSILQHSRVANVIFTLYGLFILAPPSIWRRSHDYHHAHNSKLYTTSIGSFPLVTTEDYKAASPRDRFLYLFSRHPLTIALGYLFVFIWGMCLRPLIKSGARHLDCAIALAVHLVLGFLVFQFIGLQGFCFGFLLPAILSNALGSYLFYAQHNFPDAIYKDKSDWSYVEAALWSSSFMRMNPFMQWVTGNIGYHHIHHINARIPFYKLPLVFDSFPELQNPGITSLSLSDVVACIRLKLWDPKRQKMIRLDEISIQ